MKTIIRIEETVQFLFAYLVSLQTQYSWWVFFAWLLVPDIGMVGYLINSRTGAFLYNLFHHKGIAILIGCIGFYFGNSVLQFAGIILFAHSSMDRAIGYGLKFPDDFKHTNLGWIGNTKHQ